MSTHGPHCWRSTVLIYEVGEGENTKGGGNLNQLVLKTMHFASCLFDHSVFSIIAQRDRISFLSEGIELFLSLIFTSKER